MSLSLRLLPGDYSVSQLAAAHPIPDWADGDGFVSIGRTADELSIVCLTGRVPTDHEGLVSESGWACLELVGPFAFTLTGILVAVLQPLANKKVGIFAVSTFNTDYVMVKHAHLAVTVETLRSAGHRVDVGDAVDLGDPVDLGNPADPVEEPPDDLLGLNRFIPKQTRMLGCPTIS